MRRKQEKVEKFQVAIAGLVSTAAGAITVGVCLLPAGSDAWVLACVGLLSIVALVVAAVVREPGPRGGP